jgi:phage FluMu protein gp41
MENDDMLPFNFNLSDDDFVELGYDDETVDDWIKNLPELNKKKHEFLIKVEWEETSEIYVAVRELCWHEMMDAEAHAFRMKDAEEMYLAGEHERREILKKALLWVAVIPECEFDNNEDGMILSRLNFDVVESIWTEYQSKIYLGATEASALYNAAVKYFNGEAQTNSPVPSIIVEVDMMLKFGGLSRKELRKLTSIEMEKMQTVFMARSEALGFANRKSTISVPQSNKETDAEDYSEWKSTLPPGMDEMAGQFMQPWN